MAKIKIRDIEGEADEIKDLFRDMGCDLNSYINTTPSKKKIHNNWLYVLGTMFFVLTCIIWCDLFNSTWTKVGILGIFLLFGIIIYIVHYNHDKWTITIIPIVTGLSLILICLNVYTPQELVKRIEKNATEKIDQK